MNAPVQLMLFRAVPSLRHQLGLQPAPPGAERLLAELVRRGLPATLQPEAAALCLELEAEAAERAGGLEEAS